MAGRLVRPCFFVVGWLVGWSVGRVSEGPFGWKDMGSGRRRVYALFCTRYDIPTFMKMEKKR